MCFTVRVVLLRSAGHGTNAGLASGTRSGSMPIIPNAHPHATVLAIAERAAALITSGQKGGSSV